MFGYLCKIKSLGTQILKQVHMKKNIAKAIGIAGVLLFTAVSVFFNHHHTRQAEPIERTDFLLNTFVNIKIYDSDDTGLLDNAIALCKTYEERLSRTIETSEIYELNHRPEEAETVTLSDETAELLSSALRYCDLSDGAFDITVEPVTSLWDFTSDTPKLPESSAITDAVKKIDYRNLILNGNELTFLSKDSALDLGAIAKGYIADRIKDYLISAGVESAIINLGGNVLCIGNRPDGTPFRIGLKKPFAESSETFETLNVSGMSAVTSGVYERHFIIDGKNYHHILNPKTGYPYDNGLISVTILSENSVDGDGLSTACFSLGLEKGMELVESLDDVYACFIDEDYNIYYSDGMEEFLSSAEKE